MKTKYLLGMAWLAIIPIGAADNEMLDIRPGLWEITLTVRTSGLPPISPQAAAKLKPEERARIEARIKEEEAQGPRTTVKRKCLQEKELHQPLLLSFGGGQGCNQTTLSASRSKQEIRVDCGSGDPRGGGIIRIEASDPQNAKVVSDWSGTDGKRTLKMSSTATLRWVGALCELELQGAPEATEAKIVPPAPPAKTASKGNSPAPAGAVAADGDYYYKLGKEQTDKGDFWGALRSLNRAVELDPQRATAYNARGYVYLRLQRYANASVEFSEAIRLRPDYANAYRNRATAREHLNDAEGAAADNRRAAELEKRP